MDSLQRRPARPVSEEQKLTYAGIWLLKKMDLRPEDGGIVIPMHLPSELSPLDDVLRELQVSGFVELNPKRKKECYELTRAGIAHLGALIDEAEALIDEFDDQELEDMVRALRARHHDIFRARFLWGWYDGEFDDLVLFQQRLGVSPIEPLWAYYLVSDEFFAHLALELPVDLLPS